MSSLFDIFLCLKKIMLLCLKTYFVLQHYSVITSPPLNALINKQIHLRLHVANVLQILK